MKRLCRHIPVTTKLIILRIRNGLLKKTESYSYPDNIRVINQRFGRLIEQEVDVEKAATEEKERQSNPALGFDDFGSTVGDFGGDALPEDGAEVEKEE
jgi:hypothetical protein